MTPPTYIELADRRSDLVDAVQCLLERQLRSHQVTWIWPDTGRILFATADGCTGDVEVLVNWDVVQSVTQKYSAPGRPREA